MNSFKYLFSVILATACIFYSGWYLAHRDDLVRLDDATLESTVDSTVTQLTLKQFNAEGIMTNHLISSRMEHIPKGNIHWFYEPQIQITQDDEPAWDIQSLKAKSLDGGKSIIFMDQVVVHQNPGDKNKESTLKTEEITYYPDQKKATSSLLVTFEQPGNTIQSTGMNAYLDEKRVELLHKAKGIYAPAKG